MQSVRRIGRVVAVLAMAGLGACGGAAPKGDAPSAGEKAAPAAQAAAGPKIRVAVGKFDELEAAHALLEQMGIKGVGPIITEQAVTGLVQTQRVLVLEREQLGKVIGNIQTEKEGDVSKYFDQGTTVQTGKMLGAQAMLVGALTQYEPNISGGGGGLDIPKLGSLKFHEDKAIVGLDLRLVDQQTGKVLLSAHGEATIETKSGGFSGSYSGIGLSGDAYAKTPLGQATREATKKALDALVAGLDGLPWEGGVVDAKGPDKVFIDAGEDVGMRPGARFRVVHRGEAIKGPDGAVMGYDDSEAGIVEVTSVQAKMSVAKVVEGDGPKAGDRVRALTK